MNENMKLLLDAAGWDENSVRHKQVEAALRVAGLGLVATAEQNGRKEWSASARASIIAAPPFASLVSAPADAQREHCLRWQDANGACPFGPPGDALRADAGERETLAKSQFQRGAEAMRDQCLNAVLLYRDHLPEEDETWESWYYAAFDLTLERCRNLTFDDLVEAAVDREAWINAQFFGHAVAVREKDDASIPGEPLISIEIAKDIVRRALISRPAQSYRDGLDTTALDGMIDAGLKECDLFDIANQDIIMKEHLRKFMQGAIRALASDGQPAPVDKPPLEPAIEAAWRDCTFPMDHGDLKWTMKQAFRAGYLMTTPQPLDPFLWMRDDYSDPSSIVPIMASPDDPSAYAVYRIGPAAPVEAADVLLKGATERSLIMLKAKDYWRDRALKAEATPVTPAVAMAVKAVASAGRNAVGHVGLANYAEREAEALRWISEAEDKALAALEVTGKDKP